MPGRLACFVTPARSLDQAVERVRVAEDLGYEAVFSTHIAQRDGLMTLAAYAPATARIRLGTGVIPAFPRHPVALASEAATLDELTGGRLILGIGTSHRVNMQAWYGFDMARPLSRLKEYVAILRSILTTGRAEHSGEFYRVNFAFLGYQARQDLPIYLSALSPNTLRFAGEAADGVVLWSCMPRYIREVVVPNVRAGAEAAGRDPASVEIVAAIPTAIADDVDAARDAFRREFFLYMTLPFYRAAIAGAGFADDVEAFDRSLASGDPDGARAAISDAMLDDFAGIGDEVAVRAKIDEYREAGVTLPAVGVVSAQGATVSVEETLRAAIA